MAERADRGRALTAWGIVGGFGLGGLIDGIVLHQMLQWHHLISNWVSPRTLKGLQTNTFWDGVFDLTMWVTLVAAAFGVRRGAQVEGAIPSTRRLAGTLLVGWGLFNVVDQLLFHMALGAHYIRTVSDHAVYDWGFFAMGVLLFAVPGWLLLRSDDVRSGEEVQPRGAPADSGRAIRRR